MWTKFFYLVLIIFSILNNSCLCVGKDFDDVPEVETPLGKVRGAWRTSLGGRKFAAFEGIPYAKPPVGDLRFEDPQPVQPWSEPLVATTTHVCPQIKSFMFKKREGDEDCLYLNVYYPQNAKNFDVLVLIHGGAFMVGNAHMVDASMLMDKDLVLVTLNYRLGIFGFLSTEDDAIRGNFGLKDQALALQWVKDNIASFNGKPESVTLAGLSSGGISVHLHYFSPLSKGLFARGLSQSGTALSPLAIRNNPLQSAKKLGALLNCLEGSTNDLKTCLKEAPAETIYKQLKEFYLQGKLPLSPFGPVVEKGGEPFLDAKPYDLLTQGKVLDAPWITSNVADDGLVPASFYWSELDQLKKNLTQILPLMLESNDTMPVQGRKKLLRSILDFYLGEGKKIKEKSFMNFTKILTDKLYVLPAETAAKLQSKVTKSPVYYYHFNYREGEVKAIRSYVRSQKLQGVVHGEDGLYFYAHFPEYSQQDEELRNACQNMLYAYMSTGKPTFEGVTWEPTGSTELTYLNITGPGDIKLQRSQSLTPIEFWRSTGLLDFEPFVVKDELYQDAKPEVKTPLGVVRGYWKKSLDERQYAAFEGIPYAKPPVGDLRFEEPQPIPPWTGVWEATTPHSCPQNGIFSPDAVEGQEDCLYLNVYVPAKFLDTSHKLDVIFVIHGGAFMVGSGHNIIRSEWFMDNDVVLVTINYRLGIFGFLSTEDAAIPGNNGMKDQVLALEWVKDNINSFGGNPSFVTIVGMSAGGASSHLHYFSPLSKDLFAKGVSQSGTALAPWAIKEHPLEVAKMLAVLAGCPDKSTDELKSCLKQRPMENLMKLLKFFHGDGPVPKVLFAPVIEKGCKRPFLDKDPYVLLKQGKVADAPWITSHATDDGLMPAAFFYEQWDMLNKVWTDLSPHFLDCNYTLPATRKEEVSEKVLEFYLGKGEKISKKNFKKFTQIFTDRYFAIPGEVAAKMQSKATTAPVYYYVFNYKEGANRALDIFSISPEVEGVAHGEDGVYFYGFGVQKPFSEQDKKLKNACHTMLYSFSASGLPSFGGKEFWKPTGDTKLTYLNVTGPDNLKLQTVEKLSPIDFWNSLGLEEHENVAVKDEL